MNKNVDTEKNEDSEFNKWAENYRDVLAEDVGSEYDYSEYKIREMAKANTSISPVIVDLGCGDGNCFQYIAEYIPGAKYYGIDVADRVIEEANKKWNDRGAEFICYDGRHLPFDNDSFDIVFIACVLHHVPIREREDLLKECHRVLKENGMIMIFEHNMKNPLTKRVVKRCPFDEDAVMVAPKELTKMLNKSGFQKVNVRYTLFFPRKGVFNAFIPIESKIAWCPIGAQYYCISKKA